MIYYRCLNHATTTPATIVPRNDDASHDDGHSIGFLFAYLLSTTMATYLNREMKMMTAPSLEGIYCLFIYLLFISQLPSSLEVLLFSF